MDRTSKLSEKLLKKQASRVDKQASIRDEAKKMAAKLEAARAILEKQRLAEEMEQKRLADLEAYREQERKRQEIERRTKRYYEINMYGRKVPPPDAPKYFGDFTTANVGWCPHGTGQMFLEDELKLEGAFKDGFFHGNGKVMWNDGSVWEGGIKNNRMDGIGTLTTTVAVDGPDPTVARSIFDKSEENKPKVQHIHREAIARDNMIYCFKDGK